MFSDIKLVYIFEDLISPDEFPRIINPDKASHRLSYIPEKDILSLFAGIRGYELIRHQAGVTHNGISSDLRGKVQAALRRGEIVAVETRPGVLATIGPFYADGEGQLIPYSSHEPGYPVDRIVRRYEDVVKSYGGRRASPSLFPAQVTGKKAAVIPDESTVGSRISQRRTNAPLTKAERWQERKYLIGRGQRSIYPDARIASERLAENNVAVEKAKLAENIYGNGKSIDALKTMPNVPEGWKDISNDESALGKLGIKSNMLYDKAENPDFFARVYQPDETIFGRDMNPTVVFRGSRAPGLAEGTGDTIKKIIFDDVSEIKNLKIDNLADWSNNGAQGIGISSDYYQKAVEIGKGIRGNVDISGHSLGGGMASAASMASGKSAWTFNAAGLNPGTVEKYKGAVLGSSKSIQAYRVDGELLTSLQEVNNESDYNLIRKSLPESLQKPWGVALPYTLKEWGSLAAHDAVGNRHTLLGGTGSLLDKHGIGQTIKLIEDEKDDDIAIIRSRI